MQFLPPEICSKFGEQIPNDVYLCMRNGDAQCAVFHRNNGCIVNLGAMVDFYGIKPYNVILLEYNGDGNFKTEIFNDDAVEINYPVRTIPLKKQRFSGPTGIMTDKVTGGFSNIELEKMSAKFFYNILSNSMVSYDVLIQKEHLQKGDMIQVICYFQ